MLRVRVKASLKRVEQLQTLAIAGEPDVGSSAMLTRYDVRQDSEGWSVYDRWTGEVAVIAMVPQTGMTQKEAVELAELLSSPLMNSRAIRQ